MDDSTAAAMVIGGWIIGFYGQSQTTMYSIVPDFIANFGGLIVGLGLMSGRWNSFGKWNVIPKVIGILWAGISICLILLETYDVFILHSVLMAYDSSYCLMQSVKSTRNLRGSIGGN